MFYAAKLSSVQLIAIGQLLINCCSANNVRLRLIDTPKISSVISWRLVCLNPYVPQRQSIKECTPFGANMFSSLSKPPNVKYSQERFAWEKITHHEYHNLHHLWQLIVGGGIIDGDGWVTITCQSWPPWQRFCTCLYTIFSPSRHPVALCASLYVRVFYPGKTYRCIFSTYFVADSTFIKLSTKKIILLF